MAEMFTLKHIDSTQQMPMTHTMMRTRLMKMELEGKRGRLVQHAAHKSHGDARDDEGDRADDHDAEQGVEPTQW